MKVILVAVAVVALLAGTNALECFQCAWGEGEGVEEIIGTLPDIDLPNIGKIPYHKSCNTKEPNATMAVKCPDESNACLKATSTLKMKVLDKDIEVKMAMKSCLIGVAKDDVKKKCESKTITDAMKDLSKEQQDLIKEQLKNAGIDEKSKGTVCMCTDDKCNGANSMMAVSSTIVAAVLVFLKLVA